MWVGLRAGTEADYVQWLAHSAESTGASDGCVLGYKETFLRLRKASVCWNGRDYTVKKKLSSCPCTLEDYHWYEFWHVVSALVSQEEGFFIGFVSLLYQ